MKFTKIFLTAMIAIVLAVNSNINAAKIAVTNVDAIAGCVSNTGDTTATACDSFKWYGTTYYVSGLPTKILTNVSLCDSTVTLHLTINFSTTSSTTLAACDSLKWNGTTYYTSGDKTFITTNSKGCDSTATLHLTINHSTTSSNTLAACDSLKWNGTTYYTSGDKTFVTTNVMGCDSTATLHLTINHSTTGDTIAKACNSFAWYGSTFFTSGTSTKIFTTSEGCDSTVTLHLTINYSNTGDTTATACNSFAWYGTTYITSGQKYNVLTNAGGCDSTVTLHLTINNSTTGDTSVTTCNSFIWYGMSYNTTSTPTHIKPNAMGCDSTITLHLTINYSSSIDTIAKACNSFNWNDSTYTTTPSIAPTKVLTNMAGCDSTVTLHLTIYQTPAKPIVDSIIQPTCADSTGTILITTTGAGLTYSIDGVTFTDTTGIFTNVMPGSYYVTANSGGCHSIPSNDTTVKAFLPTFTFTYPTSGAILYKGISDSIKWNTNCTSSKVNIALYLMSTKVYQIATDILNSGKFAFTPPVSLIDTNKYKIVINNIENSVSVTSAYFSIETPHLLTITYPNSGDTVYKKVNNTITWSSVNVTGRVKIALYKGTSKILQLTSGTANTGSFAYLPSTSLVNSNNYKIFISDTTNTITGTSSYFTIASTSPEITFSGDLINGFGNVPAGTKMEKTLTITNTGYKTLVVDSIKYPTCLSDSFFGNWSSGSILIDSANSVTVTCKPNQVRPYSGWIYVFSNSINGKDSVLTTITGITGINDVNAANSFNVFPNPATENITIENMPKTKAVVEISNVQGRLINTFTVNGDKTNVDISSYPSGMYFISMKTDKGLIVRKFIKE